MLIVRRIVAVIVGLAAAFAIVSAAEMLVHRMYPPPPGTNMEDMAAVKQYIATLPLTAMLLVLTGWMVGTFFGAAFAAKLAQHPIAAYVVGALLLCAGVANSIMIPQPVWFSIASFIIYIGSSLAASRVAAPS
jgi:hypothetical protein